MMKYNYFEELKYGIKTEPHILYELVKLAEWTQNCDSGLQKVSSCSSISNSSSLFNPWKIFEKSKLGYNEFLRTAYPWQLAVSQDGKAIAIIQETVIEIRTSKDEFASVVGRAAIPADQCPQLRKGAWSADNIFLAVARDNGIVNVYNVLGTVLATVSWYTTNYHDLSLKPVTGLVFFPPELRSTKWSNELFVFYNDGEVKSILLSSIDGCESEENANCSLEQYFPEGITAVASHSLHRLVAICTNQPSQREGISIWRILNDHPFVKIVPGFEKETAGRSILRFFPGYSTRLNHNSVIKIKISPDGEKLASLNYSGSISIWKFPSMQAIESWCSTYMPEIEHINPRNLDSSSDYKYFQPMDISWWSNTELVVVRKSGVVTICSTATMKNLLGQSPEFLTPSPQVVTVHSPKPALIALECETDEEKKTGTDIEYIRENDEMSMLTASFQATLYSITDMERFQPKRRTPRFTQRKYTLLSLKSTTPEELYARKIELEDYDAALALAYSYDLDTDLVYQKQWKSSPVCKESVCKYLDKVKDLYWVINECIERVPDTLESARLLLQFGLRKTEIDAESRENLNEEQKKIVSLRKQLLVFLDGLALYRRIVNDPSKFKAADYDKFRRQCPIVNSVILAHQANWLGVYIMFTFKGKKILRYWLPILSHFPETYPAVYYRRLLPEVFDGGVYDWDIRQLRRSDWAEDERFRDVTDDRAVAREYLYRDDPSLKRFEADRLTPALVQEWYIRRVYEIEKNTGIVENAYLFASLGIKKHVMGLVPVLHNLRTLYSLTYVVQDEETTLSQLESLSPLEQAKLLMSKTTPETFIQDLNSHIHPFAINCEKLLLTTFSDMFSGLLLWYSEKSLEFPLEFFRATKNNTTLCFNLTMAEIIGLALDCIYACKEPDELENSYLILECLPIQNESCPEDERELHERLDKLENHLEACDILRLYKIRKTVKWALKYDGDESVCGEIMSQMAAFTRENNLKFSDLEFDLQQLQSCLFKGINSQFCYEVVAYNQMICDDERIILLAECLLQSGKRGVRKPVPYERSVELVVKASKIHFQKATSIDSPEIKLALTCLNIITEPEMTITEELDLIESIQLLSEFGVQLLPMQVRNCTDRMKLIENCLQVNPYVYKSYQKLVYLAGTLRIAYGNRKKRECEVLLLLCKYALKEKDFEFCREICATLIFREFAGAWSLIRTLSEEDKELDNETKAEFLAFAILHCPENELQQMIEYRRMLH